MSTQRGRIVGRVAALMRAAVAVLIALTVLLIAAQRLVPGDAHWLELSRYLPYYWLLLPCLAALVASFWLGRGWALASLANLVLLATLGMGLQWHRGDEGAERVRMMTYNVKVFSAVRQRNGIQALALEVARHDPDILVMQDADGLLVERGAQPLSGGPPVFGLAHVYALGQYIVASRFPLRGCGPGQIDFRNESHRYLRCVVDVRGVDLNLVTAHFQTPRAGLNAARREGLEGADEWYRNYADRLTQARALARDLAGTGRPLVVAGDLNAPESSPVVQTLLAGGLRDAFSSAGRGYGYTWGHSLKQGIDFLRIDHILVSPDMGVMEAFAGRSDASEHRPVIADLVLRR
jgi:vancomycin resistance protein VanJ